MENVANVEMLPVPMLPIANGEALRASHFMNGGKTGSSHVSRPVQLRMILLTPLRSHERLEPFLAEVADVSEEAGLRFRQATVVPQFERKAVHCTNVVRHLENSGEHGQRLYDPYIVEAFGEYLRDQL